MSKATGSPRDLRTDDYVHLHDENNNPIYGYLSNKPYPLPGGRWIYEVDGRKIITSNIAEKCTTTTAIS